MRKVGLQSQSGKSLIELLIVISVVAVLVTFAVVRLGRSDQILQRQNIARELKVNLERARFDSVKRRAAFTPGVIDDRSRVVIVNARSFRVITDNNQNGRVTSTNGTIEGTDSRLVDFSSRPYISITGNNLVYPITILFDRRGHVTALDGNNNNITPNFAVCSSNCTMNSTTPAEADMISVSATGTVAMLRGGDSIPSFTAPNVSNVNSNIQINPLLAIWVETPTPTPTPTPSPTPLPTISPTPLPTVAPSPFACAYGERPSVTGCTCYAPMTVRASGKCQ